MPDETSAAEGNPAPPPQEGSMAPGSEPVPPQMPPETPSQGMPPEMPPPQGMPPYPPAPYAPPPPPPYTPPVEVVPLRPGPASESSKILAALSYLFAIIAIVVLFVEPYKDEKFVRFHAIQGLGLWVLGIFYWIPFVGWILGLIALVAIIVGAINAFQGKYWKVPLLYDLVKGLIDR